MSAPQPPPPESETSGNTEEDWHIYEVLCKDMKVSTSIGIIDIWCDEINRLATLVAYASGFYFTFAYLFQFGFFKLLVPESNILLISQKKS